MMAGDQIGRYQVAELLGEGGMGAVVRAYDPKNQREVAIKIIHPALLGRANVMERFDRERRVMVHLGDHANIVTVFDYVEQPFALVMELMKGRPLDVLLAEEGPLPLRRVAAYARELLDAVGFAHDQGITHRDLKPGNVMIVTVGRNQQVKVMDFGLAGFVGGSSGLTRTNARMGTPDYMAPEQHRGSQAGQPADIYALGLILFEMLTGRRPFGPFESDYEIMRAHIEEVTPPPSSLCHGIPPAIDALILRATAKNPQERFATCYDMLEALEAATSPATVPPAVVPSADVGMAATRPRVVANAGRSAATPMPRRPIPSVVPDAAPSVPAQRPRPSIQAVTLSPGPVSPVAGGREDSAPPLDLQGIARKILASVIAAIGWLLVCVGGLVVLAGLVQGELLPAVFGGVFFCAPGSVLVRIARRQQSAEGALQLHRLVIQAAAELGGRVTATDVATRTALTHADAASVLEALCDQDVCSLESRDGAPVYRF